MRSQARHNGVSGAPSRQPGTSLNLIPRKRSIDADDNLGKGMAGTAVQNMNLLFGLGETTGLLVPGAGL